MAQTVQSLFGLTPEQIQAQRAAEVDARALQYAQMDPFQQANYGIFRGASQLGDVLAQRLGYVDPLVKQAEERQGLLSGMNITDPNSLREAAQKAASVGQFDIARNLINQANEMDKSAAEADKARAEAAAKGREALTNEAKNAQSYADTVADRGTPEWAKAYGERLRYLTDKTERYGADAELIAKELYGKSITDLSPPEVAKVNAVKTSRELELRKAGATKNVTSVNLGDAIREVWAKEEGKTRNAAWKDAGEAYKMQVPMVRKLREVTKNLPNTFTGSFADTALQFGKAANALGIPVDSNKLSNTEYLNSVSSQLVQTIAKNFPGSLAVKEMDQLVKSKPNSQQMVQTLVRLMNDLDLEMSANIKTYETLNKLPEQQRAETNVNIVQADTYRKLARYRELERKAQEAIRTGKPMSKKEAEEAQRLQKDLGE